MSFGPLRVCATHGGSASLWYHGREWCWQGAEQRKTDWRASCEVVWYFPWREEGAG